jgi:hypothetical protein
LSTNNSMSTHKFVTTPTSSSKSNFKYNEDGRRYHGNEHVAYVLPNDDDGMHITYIYIYILTSSINMMIIETDRVHQQHWILKHALGR